MLLFFGGCIGLVRISFDAILLLLLLLLATTPVAEVRSADAVGINSIPVVICVVVGDALLLLLLLLLLW